MAQCVGPLEHLLDAQRAFVHLSVHHRAATLFRSRPHHQFRSFMQVEETEEVLGSEEIVHVPKQEEVLNESNC